MLAHTLDRSPIPPASSTYIQVDIIRADKFLICMTYVAQVAGVGAKQSAMSTVGHASWV